MVILDWSQMTDLEKLFILIWGLINWALVIVVFDMLRSLTPHHSFREFFERNRQMED